MHNPSHGLMFNDVAECVIPVLAGAPGRSIALAGFGLTSAAEGLFGPVIMWRLRHTAPEHFERRT